MRALSKDSVLAIHALQLMSKLNRAVTTEEIAHAGFDDDAVARVIRKLKRASVIRSHPRGGYLPAKASGELSIRDLREAVDAPRAPGAPCEGDYGACDVRASCVLAPLCRRADDALQKVMAEFRLSELADAPLELPVCVKPP